MKSYECETEIHDELTVGNTLVIIFKKGNVYSFSLSDRITNDSIFNCDKWFSLDGVYDAVPSA